jgi:hypothetical protein
MYVYIHVLHTRICQIGALSYWYIMQQEGRVRLCSHASNSNLSPCCLTCCPWHQLFCLLCSILFPMFFIFGFFWSVCVGGHNILMLGFHSLLSLNPSSLLILFGCNFISVASLTSQSFWLVPQSIGSGLINCYVLPLWTCPADRNIDVDMLKQDVKNMTSI